MRSKLMILLATSAVIGLITPSAEAFQLKINGSTVFLATHEGTTVGASPTASDPDTGTYNHMSQETSIVYSSDALYGNRSIDLAGAARGELGTTGLSTAIGDIIEVSGAIKIGGGQYFGIRFGGTGTYESHGAPNIGPGSVYLIGDPGGPWGGVWETANSAMVQTTHTSTTHAGGTVMAGEWHTYKFTHTVGVGNLTVDVDGVVANVTGFEPGADDAMSNEQDSITNSIWMNDPYNASGPGLFDAIPEPASLALLGAGGLLLLSRRRRKA